METTEAKTEIKITACNIVTGDEDISHGALAYIVNNTGGDKTRVVVKSRGRRWICKWVNKKNLSNWRQKTVVPADPAYSKIVEFTA